MGDYATTTSISNLLPQFLVGNSTSSDTANTAVFSAQIDRAENTVKSMAGARYDISAFRFGTTTTNVPPLLRTLSEDMACWFAIRAGYVQDGGRRQEYLDDYKEAKSTLTDIRDGKQVLLYTDGTEVPTRATARFLSDTDGYSHIFNMDDEESWDVDADLLDDIADERD